MKRVQLDPYCAAWPELFDDIQNELKQAFQSLDSSVQIEHIGSTAVPGLCAKPVIDVLVGAKSLSIIEANIQSLANFGYEYVSKYEVELPERRYFVRPGNDQLRVHVHGVVIGSRLWIEHLGFRDALRTDAELRAQYQALKQQLADSFADNKSAYTEAKAPFIRAVMARLS